MHGHIVGLSLCTASSYHKGTVTAAVDNFVCSSLQVWRAAKEQHADKQSHEDMMLCSLHDDFVLFIDDFDILKGAIGKGHALDDETFGICVDTSACGIVIAHGLDVG